MVPYFVSLSNRSRSAFDILSLLTQCFTKVLGLVLMLVIEQPFCDMVSFDELTLEYCLDLE